MDKMDKNAKIYIAGHRGLVGSAIVRHLQKAGYSRLILKTRSEMDLLNQEAVEDFFRAEKPEYVFLAAAKVGGIHANNTYPADFIYENLTIQNHILKGAFENRVKRLLFLGSSCIYPKKCPQPIKEEYLMTGPLEPTNSAYAVAKISGIEMCRSFNRQHGTEFIPVMPTNLYGNGDNFDLATSHVLPALIRKFHLAKLAENGDWEAIERDIQQFGPLPDDIRLSLDMEGKKKAPEVRLWGSGSPRREFLHVDDMAAACFFLMNHSFAGEDAGEKPLESLDQFLVNVGVGEDQTIRRLAEQVAEIVGFKGRISWDAEKPDGTPQKLLDVSKLKSLGWRPRISLGEGIRRTYLWYQSAGK